MSSQDELTEDQIIELREKIKSSQLSALIIMIVVGGMCLIVGIAGIYLHVAMTIFGFVSFVISLIIGRVLWNEARDLDWVLPQREKKEKKEKDSVDLYLDSLDSESEASTLKLGLGTLPKRPESKNGAGNDQSEALD
jgi:hypothetical protein